MSHAPPTEHAPNAGAQALRAFTIEHAATESGLSTRTIVSLRGGALPGDESASKLRRALGIPRDAWKRAATAYRDPPWLCEVFEILAWFPAARTVLERTLIVKSGDTVRLAEFDEIMLWGNGAAYVEHLRNAYAAEVALQEHIDDGSSAPPEQPRPELPSRPVD
jgi:hypothetical protein